MMFNVKSGAIAFLSIFNLFYLGVGIYRLTLLDTIEEEVEKSDFRLYNIRIALCFLTAISGFVMICMKGKVLKIIYLGFLIIGIGVSAYKLMGTENFSNNTVFRNKLLEVVHQNRTDLSLGILLEYFQKTEQCCGINGPHDYFQGKHEGLWLPASCCLNADELNDPSKPCPLEDAHETGCWRFFYDTNKDAGTSTFKLNLVILFSQCLASLLTLTLFKKEDVYY